MNLKSVNHLYKQVKKRKKFLWLKSFWFGIDQIEVKSNGEHESQSEIFRRFYLDRIIKKDESKFYGRPSFKKGFKRIINNIYIWIFIFFSISVFLIYLTFESLILRDIVDYFKVENREELIERAASLTISLGTGFFISIIIYLLTNI